jgi:hypothetical protein
VINTEEILDNIYHSTSDAFTDGYDTEKILLTQEVYDAFKEENKRLIGEYKGDFKTVLAYPVEIDNDVDEYTVVLKSEITW